MRISWFFDVISPYSYLSLKQFHRLPPHVEVEYVPILFAGLLTHFGQLGNAEIESKRRFTYRFIVWRAKQLGIPLRFPPSHPFNPLAALRLIIAAGSSRQVVEKVFDAVFAEGRDVQDPRVVESLAQQLGITDLGTLNSPLVKAQLRANTERAIAAQVFGVPTIAAGNELFWGHDALDMAIDYINDPDRFLDEEMKRVDALPTGVMRKK